MSSEPSISTIPDPAIDAPARAAREHLREQYHDLEQQRETAAFGMWVFLLTEVMFFGTLFLIVAVYRYLYGDAVEMASQHLNWVIGGINTIVLLASSLTAVLAVRSAQLGWQHPLARFLVLTAMLGCCFLVLKGIEYYGDYRDNLIPGWKFDAREWLAAGLTASQVSQVKLFLLLYWIMTLLHGLHVSIGIAVMLVIAALARRGRYSSVYYAPVEAATLYWHFVDIVWIFLLPMLYLLGTHGLKTL